MFLPIQLHLNNLIFSKKELHVFHTLEEYIVSEKVRSYKDSNISTKKCHFRYYSEVVFFLMLRKSLFPDLLFFKYKSIKKRKTLISS